MQDICPFLWPRLTLITDPKFGYCKNSVITNKYFDSLVPYKIALMTEDLKYLGNFYEQVKERKKYRKINSHYF